MQKYNPFSIEEKWQSCWLDNKAFKSEATKDKPKYYVLEMFPYPSGKLHMGHVRNYTIGDVVARYYRAKGYNVLHPMGWDAFGLPAENAALKNNKHPEAWTLSNVEAMKVDLNKFGLSYDWDREVATCLPVYYGKQQKWFLDLYEKGLVYQKESLVNWDPVDHTVLANEQVVDGKGWRSGAPVERKAMNQWFLRITNYADQLLNDLDDLKGWPERVKTMQANWIGRSEGLEFTFDVNGWDQGLTVYTTRPDTLMGCTYCAIAPEHPLAAMVAESDSKAAEFISECQALGTAAEDIEKAEKRGYKLEQTVVHPITGEELPVYIANFVLMSYGTGAIMSVPAHDERDYAFATKYNLPIKQVINAPEENESDSDVYTGQGILTNSGEFDGLSSEKARVKISEFIEALNKGERKVNFRLKDWGISRQRYWGCPIPFIECKDCGTVPVPAEQLPVELPKDVSFDTPGNPLDRHPTWKQVSCPCCGKDAERITDTMDTFMDSSWYFLRYADVESSKPIGDEAAYWMEGGVDQYIGGIEHAVLHLLYSRFVTKVLKDQGYVNTHEPFKSLLTQGMVINNSYQDTSGEYINPDDVEWDGETAKHAQTGETLKVNRMEKMSKSKNNGVDPNILLERYGADTLRTFMMFTAPPERDLEWSDGAIEGAWRFMGRVWSLIQKASENAPKQYTESWGSDSLKPVHRAIHKTIAKASKDIEAFQFNTLIAAIMELSNTLSGMKLNDDAAKSLFKYGCDVVMQLLNPVAPHITEELWASAGHKMPLYEASWPEFDAEIAKDDEITMVVQVNGKLKEKLMVPAGLPKDEMEVKAREAAASHLENQDVLKCVVVPNRLVNFVVKPVA
ncbi:MAG: leucine--tRNA ligase [Pseudomonadota bacterium]|nr:leucine--tRNA ligase [Pseudomonadota bacterium]